MPFVALWIESAFTLDPLALQLRCYAVGSWYYGRELQDFSHGRPGRLPPPGQHERHAVQIQIYFTWGWRRQLFLSFWVDSKKDYPGFIGEPLTKGIVVPFLRRNSITDVDQYLANVKFCFAPFCLHLSRADGSVPSSVWVWFSTLVPAAQSQRRFFPGAEVVVRGGFTLPKLRDR